MMNEWINTITDASRSAKGSQTLHITENESGSAGELYVRSAEFDERGGITLKIWQRGDNCVSMLNGEEVPGAPANVVTHNGAVIVDLTKYAADYKTHPANPEREDAGSKETPCKLIPDGSGWLLCPRCKEWMSEYYKYDGKLEISLTYEKQNYCGNCGQRLIWGFDGGDNDD